MPAIPVAVVVDGGPIGRQAVLEVLEEEGLLPVAQVVIVLISGPLQQGRVGGDVGGGQVNGSRTLVWSVAESGLGDEVLLGGCDIGQAGIVIARNGSPTDGLVSNSRFLNFCTILLN